MRMQFKIVVKNKVTGRLSTEDYERDTEEGERYVRGISEPQPVFTGDPYKWGMALVDWFNRTRTPGEAEREFIGMA